MLAAAELLRRLAIPALLLGAPLWLLGGKLPRWASIAGFGLAGVVGLIAVQGLYRLGFAGVAGADFVSTGIVQRLVWEGLLIGLAWLLWRRGVPNGARALAIAGTAHAVCGLLKTKPTPRDRG